MAPTVSPMPGIGGWWCNSTGLLARTTARDHANGAHSSSGARRSRRGCSELWRRLRWSCASECTTPSSKLARGYGRCSMGTWNYFSVSGNDRSLWWFFNDVRWRWLKSLKRRSQKAYMSYTSPNASSRRSAYDTHYPHYPVTVSTPKSEGGARCVSSARRDLCGGRGAILVPTATIRY
jgi:hypothetical protein